VPAHRQWQRVLDPGTPGQRAQSSQQSRGRRLAHHEIQVWRRRPPSPKDCAAPAAGGPEKGHRARSSKVRSASSSREYSKSQQSQASISARIELEAQGARQAVGLKAWVPLCIEGIGLRALRRRLTSAPAFQRPGTMCTGVLSPPCAARSRPRWAQCATAPLCVSRATSPSAAPGSNLRMDIDRAVLHADGARRAYD